MCTYVHISVTKLCIFGYLSYALLDLWNGFIRDSYHWRVFKRNGHQMKLTFGYDSWTSSYCYVPGQHFAVIFLFNNLITGKLNLNGIWIPNERFLVHWTSDALQWRHNERDSVSNQRRLDCLLNLLFKCRPKKTWKHRVTGPCEGNPPVTGGFPRTKGQ